jgi:hypothetical protein
MKQGKIINTAFGGMMLFMFCAGFLQGCATLEPPRFMVFANEPMGKSDELAYPELEEIYASDDKMVVVGWTEVPKTGTYSIRVLLQNGRAEAVYDEQKEVNAKIYEEKPIVLYENSIPLNAEFKTKLSPINTLYIYCDNRVLVTKQLKYAPQDVHNRNIKQVVMLPFFSKAQETFDYRSKDRILNTFADALGCEIKRITPEVIPHYITEQKIADLKVSTCLQNPTCRARLKEIFGEGVFITGNVNVPKYTHEFFNLQVYVFDSQTGKVQEFKSSFTDESETYIEPKMRKIIKGILVKEGLWAYLRGL